MNNSHFELLFEDLCVMFMQRLGMFGPLRCGEMYALDRLLREARVMELIRLAVQDTLRSDNQPEEGKFILRTCNSWRK